MAFPCCPGGEALPGGTVVGSHRRSEHLILQHDSHPGTSNSYQPLLFLSLVVVDGTEHRVHLHTSPQPSTTEPKRHCTALHLIPDTITDNYLGRSRPSGAPVPICCGLEITTKLSSGLRRGLGAPSLATPATGLQSATLKLLPELQPPGLGPIKPAKSCHCQLAQWSVRHWTLDADTPAKHSFTHSSIHTQHCVGICAAADARQTHQTQIRIRIALTPPGLAYNLPWSR
ncbi:hypothetical protein B0T18DRAFT_127619 [Schizothecium vesticola]|uniref:Uncharacterized protein n=1 Tax=Schizothecium vesticola TaxID=314040 RepID=A0AA40F3T0_9PEZI|nr:hypothetical protein B0T18DRAFT_127619 [Schizothecium vesticola]